MGSLFLPFIKRYKETAIPIEISISAGSVNCKPSRVGKNKRGIWFPGYTFAINKTGLIFGKRAEVFRLSKNLVMGACHKYGQVKYALTPAIRKYAIAVAHTLERTF